MLMRTGCKKCIHTDAFVKIYILIEKDYRGNHVPAFMIK